MTPDPETVPMHLEPLPSYESRHAWAPPDWAHDTMPGFPAVTGPPAARVPLIPPCRCEQCEWALAVAGGYDGPCRCDTCRYGRRPGSGVVLYSRPGTADVLWALDVRDGRREDIEGLFDAAWRRSRQGFESAARNARRTLNIALSRVEAVAAAERRAA